MSAAPPQTVQPPADARPVDLTRVELAGRVDFLFRIGRFYLFLPFAALCMAAALFQRATPQWLTVLPFILQLCATLAGFHLVRAYERRDPSDDPAIWAGRYTLLSALSGMIWGMGAVVWFTPNVFPAQAYLALAFLGMTASEFIARAAYRPAYLAHASLSLGPLALMLFLDGHGYAMMTCILVMFFGGVLYSYCEGFSDMLNDGIRLRFENMQLVARLSGEKVEAEKARDAAQASARAKSVFIANISHEIRTPLNALLGMAQLLEQGDLGHAQRNHVKVILEAGRGLKTLLDDVITLSSQEGDEPPEYDCDAVQAVRTVARLLQPSAWEKKLNLVVTAPSELPRAAGDPRRIRQILLKLAENALKFTETGSVDIAVALQGDDRIRFSVSDTGLGIPPEVARSLFEPFSLGDNSYARRHQGAGLGLAVARHMVEAMNGTIGFESAAGEGSLFWFTLPVARAISAPMAEPQESSETSPAGLALLVLLPDAQMRAQVSRYLEPYGNRLTFAENLPDATARAGREHFDAVITDGVHADMLGASPSVRQPLLALLKTGEPASACAGYVLHMPLAADALYGALHEIARVSGTVRADGDSAHVEAAIDVPAFVALEKSLGLVTLIEILQSYTRTAEELCQHLTQASDAGQWDDAAHFAQDIAGAAGGLGLGMLTQTARTFMQKAREGGNADELHRAAQSIAAEHARVSAALITLYPDLAA